MSRIGCRMSRMSYRMRRIVCRTSRSGSRTGKIGWRSPGEVIRSGGGVGGEQVTKLVFFKHHFLWYLQCMMCKNFSEQYSKI
jgi:hypothetical protein